MTDVQLSHCRFLQRDETREQRLEAFCQTLNDAFKHFQKLWDDYKEVLSRPEESAKGTLNHSNKVQNIVNDVNECCTCGGAKSKQSTAESAAVPNEKNVNCNPMGVDTKSTKSMCDQSFQIFSQDFSTQGLEESFKRQSQTPLQEIQNKTPKRPISPIFGSKKGKPRTASPTVSSPGLSEKSVVILNDLSTERSFGSKWEIPCTAKPVLDTGVVPLAIDATPSPTQFSFPISDDEIKGTPKTIRKLGISTTHNVQTDIIIGTKKRLKQSKICVTTEKVTDLSNYKVVSNTKSDDCRVSSKCDNALQPNDSSQSRSHLEDSLIQVSPTHKSGLSKIRQKMSRRNKSAEILQHKLNIAENSAKDSKHVKKSNAACNDSNFSEYSIDVTRFEPKLASTQYDEASLHSDTLKAKELPIQSKWNLPEKMGHEEEAKSSMDDDTLYLEHVPACILEAKDIPDKSGLRKKLSLRKKSTELKNTVVLPNDDPNRSDKELSESVMDISLDTSDEFKVVSPPRKKKILTNFDIVPKKKNNSPTYAYKGSPIRKRADRALLNGWSCLECQKYYEAIGLDEQELEIRKNVCSRHRSKFNDKNQSPQDYWNPDFSCSFHSTMWND